MTKSTGKAIEAAKNIQLALKARRKDPSLNVKKTSILFNISRLSIQNHENTIKKEDKAPIRYDPDYHVKFQRLTPIKEATPSRAY